MTDQPKLLFDPSRIDLPELDDLIASSSWVADMPGLAEEVEDLREEVVHRRSGVRRRARHLARATPDRAMAEGVARIAAAAGKVATSDALGTLRHPTSVGALRSRSLVEQVDLMVRAGGPAWVKLGQFVATAGGLLPREWVEAFAWCRDDVAPLAPEVPRRMLQRAFRCPVDAVFAEFDDEPIGAASIAQVHRGVLLDGREVVVKLRRPGLSRRFATDIRAMAGAAWAAEQLSPVMRAGNPSGFLELFAQLVLEELDFRIEALNMVELGVVSEHSGSEMVRIPRPVPTLVTKRVLVMERLPGTSYASVQVEPEVGQRMFRYAVRSALELTLLFGVFHGDLHAGNILIDEESATLSLVDFGILGRLDEQQRIALGQLMVAFAHGDVRAELDAMVRFGAIPPDQDLSEMEEEIRSGANLHSLAPDARREDLAEGLTRLLAVVSTHGIRLPKELVLFCKNLLYINGFAAAVAPDVKLLNEVAPVFGYIHQKYPDAFDLSAFNPPN